MQSVQVSTKLSLHIHPTFHVIVYKVHNRKCTISYEIVKLTLVLKSGINFNLHIESKRKFGTISLPEVKYGTQQHVQNK